MARDHGHVAGMVGETLKQLRITMTCAWAAGLLILSGCVGQKRIVSREVRFSPAQTGVLRVMTFNIRTGMAWWDGRNHWSRRKQIVVDTLVDNAADVIGLQEALAHQLSAVQKALPQYSVYAVGRNDGRQRGETCAILYRKDRFKLLESGTFWFSNTPYKPGSRDWGNIFPRICSWVHLADKADNVRFYVYNVHLDNWSQNSREKSVRLLAGRIAARKTEDPFVVMGDFNMELDNPAMRYLQKIGYQNPWVRMADAWVSTRPNKNGVGTYHRFTGATSCPRIDHIETSEYAQVLDVRIDRRAVSGRYPSDHFPVTATLLLRTTGSTSTTALAKQL